MKIAYVALTGGDLSGGARKHLGILVRKLRERPDVEWVNVFVHPNLVQPGEYTWPKHDWLFNFRELRRSLAAMRPDVLFIATARLLKVPDIPTVTMVRNMEPLEVPFEGNTAFEGMKNLFRAISARRAAEDADRVIAVSGHVRDFLLQRWHLAAHRIGKVYHGIDLVPDNPGIAPKCASVFQGSRFLFTAGSVRPARGLEDLVEALPHVPEDVRVVIAGTVNDRPYYRRLERLAKKRGVRPRIHCVGQLDPNEMTWCFRNAVRFVTTSHAEACPNTVLEAMAHGAVSISTNLEPMPEFFRDAAIYYRKRDGVDLARRINESLALTDEEATRFRERAIARASEFTWEATARNTVEELRLAIEER